MSTIYQSYIALQLVRPWLLLGLHCPGAQCIKCVNANTPVSKFGPSCVTTLSGTAQFQFINRRSNVCMNAKNATVLINRTQTFLTIFFMEDKLICRNL